MKKIFTLTFLFSMLFFAVDAQVLVNEDFEGGSLPEGWTQVTSATDGGFLFGTGSSLASTFWGLPDHDGIVAATNDDGCNCDKADDKLVMPPLDLTDAPALRLTFDLSFAGNTYAGAMESAFIEYSLDGGETWTSHTEIVGEGPGVYDWTTRQYDLSDIAGNSNVLIAFRYNDGGGWLYGFAIDNVLLMTPFPNDVSIDNVVIDRYTLVDTEITIGGDIQNEGLDPVTSVDVNWTDGTNTFTDNLTGLNIMPGESMSFEHTVTFDVPDAIQYDIDVNLTNPNAVEDEFPGNNSLVRKVSGLTFVPEKRVVAEEGTGTWCGWCPRGTVGMDYMVDNYPETFIGIAVHNGDPMVVSEYDSGMGLQGYPGSHVNRVYNDTDPNAQNLENLHNAELESLSPAGISQVTSYESDTREMTIEVTVDFATQVTGEFRTNVVITEDGVTGTGSGYSQANFYSGGGNGPMGGYENLPDPVPFSDMVYDHVARAILGGWAGTAGSIPATNNGGDAVTYTYTYTLPEYVNEENVHVISMLIDSESGAILNSNQGGLDMINNIQDVFDHTLAEVFPNPFSDVVNVRLNLETATEVNLRVLNSVGQTVAERNYGSLAGENLLPFYAHDLANGMYTMHLTLGDKLVTKKVMLQR